jgi:hypothetical protein
MEKFRFFKRTYEGEELALKKKGEEFSDKGRVGKK